MKAADVAVIRPSIQEDIVAIPVLSPEDDIFFV